MKDVSAQNGIRSFRRRISFMSGAMILLSCVMNLTFIAQEVICTIVSPFLIPVGFEVFYYLTYGVAYAASFLIPAFLLRIVIKEDVYPKGYKIARGSKDAGLWMLLTLGLIYCWALLNGYLMNFFYGIFGQPNTALFDTRFNGIHTVLLEVLTMAIIPGLCEEILFRGVLLKRLLPFGKDTAVIISALFFSLMHQMPLQFFYTFAAGVMLGYLYIGTGSVWCGVAVHTMNNLLSIITSVLEQYLDEKTSSVIFFLIYALLGVLALVSLLILARRRKRAYRARESVFGRTEPVPLVDAPTKIKGSDAVKGFFTPTTIVFLCIYFLITVVNFFSLYRTSI